MVLATLMGACTNLIGQHSLKGKLLNQSTIRVLSEHIMINGNFVSYEEEVVVEAGSNEIIFNGELFRKEVVKNMPLPEHQSKSLEGLGCIALLPLCLVANLIPSAKPDFVAVKIKCVKRSLINTVAGHVYSIHVKRKDYVPPSLVVSTLTYPQSNLSEEPMECEDVDI